MEERQPRVENNWKSRVSHKVREALIDKTSYRNPYQHMISDASKNMDPSWSRATATSTIHLYIRFVFLGNFQPSGESIATLVPPKCQFQTKLYRRYVVALILNTSSINPINPMPWYRQRLTTSQLVQEIENQAIQSQQQIVNVRQQMAIKTREIRMLELTSKEVGDLPSGTNIYEGVGKM